MILQPRDFGEVLLGTDFTYSVLGANFGKVMLMLLSPRQEWHVCEDKWPSLSGLNDILNSNNMRILLLFTKKKRLAFPLNSSVSFEYEQASRFLFFGEEGA